MEKTPSTLRHAVASIAQAPRHRADAHTGRVRVREKPGQYGDAQQTIQRFTDLEGAHAATVAKLSKGDKVRLEWDHNYVTSPENGGEQAPRARHHGARARRLTKRT